MTLNRLVRIASAAYPDGLIAAEYWDFKRERPRRNFKGGDTLAMFIAMELKDTYDPGATDTQQLETAFGVIARAQGDLSAVGVAFTAELEKRQGGQHAREQIQTMRRSGA